LEERAALVQPRLAKAEGRIHVEMGIDEGRAHQPAPGIDLAPGLGRDRRSDLGDPPILDGDVHSLAAVRQVRTADQKIQHRLIPVLQRWANQTGSLARSTMQIPGRVARVSGYAPMP